MARAIISIEQGVHLDRWSSATAVHAITSMVAAIEGGSLMRHGIEFTIPAGAIQMEWRNALITQVNAWALANGHTVERIILPDLSVFSS